jgi:hypothetical protein
MSSYPMLFTLFAEICYTATITKYMYIKGTQGIMKMCPFISSCTLYTGSYYMHYSLMEIR